MAQDGYPKGKGIAEQMNGRSDIQELVLFGAAAQR